jgi:hypothetical protein
MDAASRDFQFFTPSLSFFEKSGAPEGFRRRIGGLVSTEGRDQEAETVLQRGLDFSYFLNRGYFNDNHAKHQFGVLGYPDHVQLVKKGQRLPDGTVAPNDGTWAEGYLLEGYRPSDELWQLGKALQKTGGRRRLGFSIEGVIQKRAGEDRKTIAKALVKHVAITHCPVNPETGLAILVKSLETADDEREDETIERALSSGGATSNAKPVGPQTGGAGRVITSQSLDHDAKTTTSSPRQLSKAEAVAWVMTRFPNLSAATAGRCVDAALLMKRRGAI